MPKRSAPAAEDDVLVAERAKLSREQQRRDKQRVETAVDRRVRRDALIAAVTSTEAAARAAARAGGAAPASKRKRQPRPQLPLTRRLYTIEEFCLMHRISRSGFYNLQAKDKAPRITKVGQKRFISEEHAAEWRAKLEVTDI